MYSSVEQYLARTKALFVGEPWMARRALTTNDPVKLKRMLYQLRKEGLEGNWLAIIDRWLIPALEAKFSQNAHAKKFLLNTESRAIGKASFDIFWGIGLILTDKEVCNQTKWKGENSLGQALVQVRKALREQASKEK